MGFGNVASTIIMFIAVMLIATGVIVALNTNIQQSQNSMRVQTEFLNNQIKTNIDITQVNYTGGQTTIYAINNGKTILKLDKTDVYLDYAFIPRNESNRSIRVEPSTDTTNPGLWDPGEIIKINISKTLGAGEHITTITTHYGVQAQETFST